MDWPALARRLAPIGLVVAGLLLFAGCDRKPGGAGIDAEWHRRSLMDTHLARWFKVAPTESGLFRTAFNRTWQEQPNSSGDLTGQSRLVYALLAGYEQIMRAINIYRATGESFENARYHGRITSSVRLVGLAAAAGDRSCVRRR